MRLDAWLTKAASRLAGAGVEGARTEARVLVGHGLRVDSAALYAHPEWEAPAEADELLARRLAGEPLAYIVGSREFYGRRFRVGPAVLIPRQETELLVETALRFAPPGARILDVGAGSGCIGITLKLERPDLTLTGVDVSPKALAVARENASALGADVAFIEADLFPPGEFDFVVSNPPYVAEGAILPRDVGEFEPRLALLAGSDGLAIYRRLAGHAREHVTGAGLIAVELGDGMRFDVEAVFTAHRWNVVEVGKDLFGIERVMVFSTS